MRKFRLFSFSLLLFSLMHTAFAQTKPAITVPGSRSCGTPPLPDDFENWLQPLMTGGTPRALYTLPVVVHVIHNGEALNSGSNISNAQIQSQIDILNRDFRKLNTDITNVPAVWTSRAADCQINFCLAQTDPSGNPMAEPGVHRVNRNTAGFTAPPYSDTYIDNTIKPATIWNPNQYLNIWVMNLGGGLLGYATFPASSTLSGLGPPYGTMTSDGVVILNTAFGNMGSVVAPYNLGRTATHEIGHWLGLRHIWGDASCGNDFCTDTPTQQSDNGGCPSFPSVTCSNGPNGDMFMNYMDYVNDACMYMFTNDQATRVQTCMANSPLRIALATSTKCNPPYALDAGIESVISPTGSTCVTTINPVVELKNFGSSTLTSVTINYQLDGGTVAAFAWTGSLTTGSGTNVNLPAMSVGTGAHTYTAYTSGPNGGTDAFAANNSSSSSFTIITPPAGAALPFTQGFQSTTFVPAGWTLVNPDANTTWARTTAAGGFGASSASARFDNYSPTTTIAGQSDYMITPAINLATAPGTIQMSFDVAYARYNATLFDSLIVSISTNCGSTWTRVYANGGSTLATAPDNGSSAFTPSATQWRTDNINLSAYIGSPSVQFRFENKSGWGQRLYLDNINLTHTPGAGPTADFTGSPTSVCAGQSVTFTNTSTGSPTSYAWTFTGGTPATSTAANPTITYNTAGTYAVSLVATNGSGSDTETKTGYITVKALPTATATNGGAVCAGGTITLSTPAVAGATYSWSGPLSYTSSLRNPSITGATTAMAGTYTVTVTANGCSSTSSTTVTVNPAPTATATNTGGYCVGQTISLSTPAVTGATYAWTGPLSYTSSIRNPNITGATTGMAGTYTVTVTAGGCSATSSTTVAVNALPVATATNGGTVCAGGTITLSTPAVTGATYTWSGPLSYSSPMRNPGITGATTAMSGVYTVTVTNGGCSNTSSTTVTVNPAPTASASNDGAYCAGENINLSTTTVSGASYSWSGPGTYTSTLQNPVRTSATTAMAGTYTVTVTVGTCTATSSTTVVVNPLPNASANNTGPVCEGQSFTVTTPTVGSATYSWTGPAGFTASIRNPTITGATTAMSGVYTVTVTNPATGCSRNSSTTVVVNPGPVSNATNSSPLCEGTTLNLNTTTVSGATYSWSGPGGYVSSAQNPIISGATAAASGTYTVTVTVGACSTSSSTTVTIQALPMANAVNNGPVCEGATITLGTDNVSGATYAWSGPAGFTSLLQNPVLTGTTAAAGTYTVTVTAAGCSNTSSTVISVNPLPNVLATNDGPGCEENMINLATPAVTGGIYTWSGPAGFTSSLQNPALGPVNSTMSGTYTVTVTDGNGCTNSSTTNVSVNTLPLISAGADVFVCPGESVSLTATGGTTYTWSPSTGLSSTTTASTVSTPAGTITYMVTGSNGTCTNADSVTVNVFPAPPVPVVSHAFDSLMVTPSTGYTYQWYFNGSPISGATGPVYHANNNGEYTVEITDANGCTSGSGNYLYNSTGIMEAIDENGFSLYPNPGNGQITLLFKQPVSNTAKIMVIDGLGQVVYDNAITTHGNNSMNLQLNVSGGAYTVVVTDGNNRYYRKLIINN